MPIFRSEGHNPYIIPPGGFSTIGTWGYIDAWQEMMQQVHTCVKYTPVAHYLN